MLAWINRLAVSLGVGVTLMAGSAGGEAAPCAAGFLTRRRRLEQRLAR